MPLNYSALVAPPPPNYRLGPGDVLEVLVPQLLPNANTEALEVRVLESGAINLPIVGAIHLGGLTVSAAQRRINQRLAEDVLVDPRASVNLIKRGTVNVVVLGAVQEPGVHPLPRYENDVGHAIAAAGGLTKQAGEAIEIHRRAGGFSWPRQTPREADRSSSPEQTHQSRSESANGYQGVGFTPPPEPTPTGNSAESHDSGEDISGPLLAPEAMENGSRPEKTPLPAPLPSGETGQITRIPLKGIDSTHFEWRKMVLGPADVVHVPKREPKVFYVVGQLSRRNRVRFSLNDRDREVGNGFLLPPDREIDVVSAVAMAGYLDPINSPTTATVQRTLPSGESLLIDVDLIEARTNPRENVIVRAGDIIYLDPNGWWYFRRLMDSVIQRALGTATGVWLGG